MRLLVTGGTGFLGRPFVERCVKEGHEVMVIGRHDSAISGTRSLRADFADPVSLEAAQKQAGEFDILVHLGALVYKKPEEDIANDMAETNILGTIRVLEILGKTAKLVVCGSTAEVYGLSTVNGPIDEKLLPKPLSNYGASKLAAEHFCHVFSARNDVPVTMLRFSVMYGALDPIARAIPNFIKKALSGDQLEVYGGEELRDYLHVEDAVEALICALKSRKTAVYNVGSGVATSVRDAATAVVGITSSTSELSILPRQKKAADLVLDITAIKNDLGFRPKYIFPKGIENQVAWQKKSL